uniref:Obscurin n=1 Tax=Gouania willdenowi TaxID=441366 RepID=A0A8C5DBU7_GOUWI
MDQNAFGGVPRFLTRPKAFSVCAGKDATLSCAIVGSPTPLITWEKGKLKLTSGNRFQTVEDGDVYRLTIYDLTLEDSGQYMCRAKNSVGEAYAAVTLKVALPSEMSQRAPVFMVKPSSTRVLLGGDVVFHSRVAAHPEANFEWEKDGRYLGATNRIKMVSDSDTSTLKIQGVRNLDAGTYTCRAQNVVGRAHAAATLVVDSLEYELRGKHAKLSCFVTGHPKPHIMWRKDGGNINEGRRHVIYEDQAENFILKILYCKQADNGLYTCNATNMAGETYSAVLVTVKEPKVPFRRKLQDVEVQEKMSALLLCEVPQIATRTNWFMEETRLEQNNKYRMEEDGTVRRLTIHNVTTNDDGVYICEMNEGSRTVAELTVLGNITKKLPRRTVVPVSDTVIFCVELEQPCPDAYWTRNGEKLKEDARIAIGYVLCQYTLTIRDCQADDSGEVAFMAGDCKTSTPARKHPPDPPINAVVQNKTDSSITIHWSPPDTERPVPIKGYVVEKRKVGTQTWQRCNASQTITSTQVTVCSFSEEASYQFRISAMNDFGQSPYLEVPGSFYLEPTAHVTHGLTDSTAINGEEFSISVQLSAVCSGFWSLNGRLLRSGADFLITRSKSTHTLLIRVVTMEMNGAEVKFVVTCSVQDSAQLTAEESVQREVKAALSHKASLSCEVADAKTEVKWYKDGKLLSSTKTLHTESKGRSRQLLLDSVEKKDAGEYVCEVGTERMAFRLQVEGEVGWLEQNIPSEVRASLTQKATLSCEVSDPKVEVKWYKDGKLLKSSKDVHMESKGHSRQLVIEKMEKKDVGEYTCEVGTERLAFRLQVEDYKSDNKVKAALSHKASLSCEVADAKTEVKWYKDGKLLSSTKTLHTESKGRSRQLLLDSVEKKDAGEYVCEVGTERMAFRLQVEGEVGWLEQNIPSAKRLCVHENVLNVCEVSDPKVEVKWYKDGKLLKSSKDVHMESKGHSRQLVIEKMEKKDVGEYTCEVGTERLAFRLQVEENRPHPCVRSINLHNELNCEVADAKTEVKWYKDGKLLSSTKTLHTESKGRSRQLLLDSVEKKDAGEYVCEVGTERMAFRLQVEGEVGWLEQNIPSAKRLCVHENVLNVSCRTSSRVLQQAVAPAGGENVHMESKGHSRQLVIEKMEKKDVGEYTCEAAAEKLSFKLQLKEPNLKKVVQESLSVQEKESVVLTAEVTAESDSIRWFRNDVELKESPKYRMKKDGLSTSLTINSCDASDSGTYSCRTADDHLDFRVQVKGTLSLSCELSHASADVLWRCSNREIKPGARHSLRAEGARRILVVTAVTKEDEGEYSCECRDDRTSAKVSTTAPRVARFTTKVNNVAATEGKDALFKCAVSPVDATVKWFHNGVAVTTGPKYRTEQGGGRHSLTVVSVTQKDAGDVRVDAEGKSCQAALQVQREPVMFKKKLENLVVEEQSEVHLQVELSRASDEVRWMKNSVVLQPTGNMEIRVSGTKQELLFKSVTQADRGFYSCETLDDKTQAKLSVEARKVHVLKALTDTTAHISQTVTLEVELSQPDVEGTWTKDGTKLRRGTNCLISALGPKHTVTLSNLRREDAGLVSFTSGPYLVIVALELPVKFVKKLRDKIGMYKHHAHLECQVSRPSAVVHWFKNKTEIKAGPKYEIKSEGVYRKLTINDVDAADEDTYVCDATDDRTSCKLLVEGITINNRAD